MIFPKDLYEKNVLLQIGFKRWWLSLYPNKLDPVKRKVQVYILENREKTYLETYYTYSHDEFERLITEVENR